MEVAQPQVVTFCAIRTCSGRDWHRLARQLLLLLFYSSFSVSPADFGCIYCLSLKADSTCFSGWLSRPLYGESALCSSSSSTPHSWHRKNLSTQLCRSPRRSLSSMCDSSNDDDDSEAHAREEEAIHAINGVWAGQWGSRCVELKLRSVERTRQQTHTSTNCEEQTLITKEKHTLNE